MPSLSAEASQFDTTVVSDISSDLQAVQFDVTTVFNIPSEEVNSSQFDVVLPTTSDGIPIEVSQFDLLAVVRGRIEDPSLRAWTFTLDGHDFYVLRLGDTETLVYDLTTEQWSRWGSGDSALWDVSFGVNWIGGNTLSDVFGSNIVVGSALTGALFFLDPNKPDDDAAIADREAQEFRRLLTGQVPVRGYNKVRVFEIQLLGSVNELEVNANPNIVLYYSDDRGDSYVSAGTIVTQDTEYDIRASWRSLGAFSSPGRLFRVEDYGALKRVDSLTINTNLNQPPEA